MYRLVKMVIFHCYVSLPEGRIFIFIDSPKNPTQHPPRRVQEDDFSIGFWCQVKFWGGYHFWPEPVSCGNPTFTPTWPNLPIPNHFKFWKYYGKRKVDDTFTYCIGEYYWLFTKLPFGVSSILTPAVLRLKTIWVNRISHHQTSNQFIIIHHFNPDAPRYIYPHFPFYGIIKCTCSTYSSPSRSILGFGISEWSASFTASGRPNGWYGVSDHGRRFFRGLNGKMIQFFMGEKTTKPLKQSWVSVLKIYQLYIVIPGTYGCFRK